MKRRSLVQARESFLPLAGLLVCLLGRAEGAAALLGAFLLARLCALCPDAAYPRAAADELNARALARFRKTALLMLLGGAAVSGLLLWGFVRPLGLLPEAHLALCWAAATAMLGCRVFCAFLAVDGETDSAALAEGLLALLLAAAMLLGDPGWRFGAALAPEALAADPRWDAPLLAALAAGLMLLISGFVSRRTAPPAARGQKPALKPLRRAPMALLRTLLCPLLLAALTVLSGPGLLPAALAGWALYAVSTALYRRSPAETPALAAALVPGAALLAALALLPGLLPAAPLPPALRDLAAARLFGLPAAALPISVAALLALALNAHFSPALAVSIALLALQGVLSCCGTIFGVPGVCCSLLVGALALLSAVPFWREALVSARAARTRRRYQKRASGKAR